MSISIAYTIVAIILGPSLFLNPARAQSKDAQSKDDDAAKQDPDTLRMLRPDEAEQQRVEDEEPEAPLEPRAELGAAHLRRIEPA